MKKLALKFCNLLLALVLVFQMVGCGTVLYPERRGQNRGDIDPGVAIMDGIGLLFFIIPGLVAFVIDFQTGTIYLPPGKTTKDRLNELMGGNIRILNEEGRFIVKLDPEELTPDMIDRVIQATTGHRFSTNDPELEVHRLDGFSHFHEQFQRFASNGGDSILLLN